MGKLCWPGKQSLIRDLGSATLGTAWVTMGTAFRADGVNYVGVFVDVKINDSNDVRLRMQGLLTANGSGYNNPIDTQSADVIKTEDAYRELNVDADQKLVVQFDLKGLCPYARLQSSVGTEGGTAATMNCSVVTAL
jgi:hypothetical protein